MPWTLLEMFDLIGTIAFAISGASVGIDRNLDIFGVNVLAVSTACGGGLVRDMIVGNRPPGMFKNPFYVLTAVLVANTVFTLMYMHQRMPRRLSPVWEQVMFWFDTLGLAAFTVDGVMIGIRAGYFNNMFLLTFVGFLTGVGGGVIRDVLAVRIPDILRKHVYAMASIAGGMILVILLRLIRSQDIAMVAGFSSVVLLRFLASHYRWNLPKVRY